jgi:hypothetical protein
MLECHRTEAAGRTVSTARATLRVGFAGALAIVALSLTATSVAHAPASEVALNEGIHKIQHVVMIDQENRSFDSYFGTYPGANGIPAGVCVPDSLHGSCMRPYHDPNDKNFGGPHGTESALKDINGGQMNGFVEQVEQRFKCAGYEPYCSPCKPGESGKCIDVMGYHDARASPKL